MSCNSRSKERPGSISRTTKANYHLLSSAFSESIAIAQIVDLNVLYIVTVLLVDIAVNRSFLVRRAARWRQSRRRTDDLFHIHRYQSMIILEIASGDDIPDGQEAGAVVPLALPDSH